MRHAHVFVLREFPYGEWFGTYRAWVCACGEVGYPLERSASWRR